MNILVLDTNTINSMRGFLAALEHAQMTQTAPKVRVAEPLPSRGEWEILMRGRWVDLGLIRLPVGKEQRAYVCDLILNALDGRGWCDIDTVADGAGYGINYTRAYMATLEAAGLVEIAKAEHGKRLLYRYTGDKV